MSVDEMFNDLTGTCPNCNRAVGFVHSQTLARLWPEFNLGRHSYNPLCAPPYKRLQVIECMSCKKSVTAVETVEADETDATFEIVVPAVPSRQLAAEVPTPVRELFAEASQCENVGAMRGAAVLYRAAVEELVKDRGAEGPNLYKKIESIREQLSSDVYEDLHEARMLGNDSIHHGITYSPAEVADVADLIEQAVVEIYVQPAQRRAMQEARRARRDGARP